MMMYKISVPSISIGISPRNIALSRVISSWYSRSRASLGSSFIFGLFLMFLALSNKLTH